MTAGPFDVAVVGGGPGGAACALEASRLGLSPVLLDPQGPEADKPCGEGIMPSGVGVLVSLGLSDLVSRGRPFPGLRHVVRGARPLDLDLPSPGVALRRPDLHRALHAALSVAPRVSVVPDVAHVDRDGDGFVVFVGRHRDGLRLRARALVAADGLCGRVAPWLRGDAPRRPPSTRFGIRARFHDATGLDRVEVHAGGGCEVYLTPLPGSAVNVAVLFERPPDAVAGADALLAWGLSRHPLAAARLGPLVTPPEARPLGGARPRRVAGARTFLVGDAGGLVDPILGCGTTIALRTGVLAARSAAALLAGRPALAVERAYARSFRRESLARHALASLLRRGDGHPRLSAAVVGVLRRAPRVARSLVRVAAGIPFTP